MVYYWLGLWLFAGVLVGDLQDGIDHELIILGWGVCWLLGADEGAVDAVEYAGMDCEYMLIRQ